VPAQTTKDPGTRTAAPEPAAARLAPHVVPEPAAPERKPEIPRTPAVPDRLVGAGMVWPPIAGRHVLNEITDSHPQLRQLANEAWLGESDRWLLLSVKQHAFDSETLAREEMLRLARSHSLFKTVLSEHRCISCTLTEQREWRIWQVVRRETTLADVLRMMLELQAADSIVTELLRVAYLLGAAAVRFSAASLTCAPTLDTIAVSHSGPVYTGFLLPAGEGTGAPLEGAALLRSELQGAITGLAQRPELVSQLLRQLEASKRSAPPGDPVAETLIAMFLQNDTRA
jgi:hypothetical protein